MDDKKDVQIIISELLDSEKPLSPSSLHFFSDISNKQLVEIKAIWEHISVNRRLQLLKDLENLLEIDTLVNFDKLGIFILSDPDDQVRCQAIRLLWENEEPNTCTLFCKILRGDTKEVVRAAAAYALGKFILLGELEEIPNKYFVEAEELLFNTYKQSEYELVKQKAFEALGYSERAEMKTIIQQAYAKDDNRWKTSVLIAMGRSADNSWEEHIIQHIHNPIVSIREEAIRAAGELELKATREILLELLEEEERDECWPTIIWALSKIGGEGVQHTFLEMLKHTKDEEEIEILEMALENLAFTSKSDSFDLFGENQ